MSTTQAPPAKKWTKTPETKRLAARRLIESGVSFHDVSLSQSIPVDTLRTWARRDKWLTPAKLQKVSKAAREAALTMESNPPCTVQPETQLPATVKPQLPNNQLSTLLSLAESGPPEFAKSAASFLQSLLAENAGSLEINNLRDWKDVFTMWRQAAGLDKQVVSGGSAPLVNPLRTVSRRAVVDAEIVAGGSVDDWEP